MSHPNCVLRGRVAAAIALGSLGVALSGCGSGSDFDGRQALELEKTGGTYAASGGVFMYHLRAINPGPDPVSNARVVDQLAPETDMGALLVEFTAPWECATDLEALEVVCTIDSFPPGAADFDLGGFFTDALAPGQEVENRATVSADGAVSAEAAWISTVLAETSLAVTKSAPPTAAPGEVIRYDLTMTNTGETLALTPEIQEYLPDDTFPTGFTAPPDWECGFVPVGPARYICQGPILEPGAMAEISLSIRIAADAMPGTVLSNRIVGLAQNSRVGVEANASTEIVSPPAGP